MRSVLATKENKSLPNIHLNVDCWIRITDHEELVILLEDPNDLEAWYEHNEEFTHYPAGHDIPAELWDSQQLHGLGRIY